MMFEKIKNIGLGKSPFAKGVAKPGDLFLPHGAIKLLMYKEGNSSIEKSPFNSPFIKGDEEKVGLGELVNEEMGD